MFVLFDFHLLASSTEGYFNRQPWVNKVIKYKGDKIFTKMKQKTNGTFSFTNVNGQWHSPILINGLRRSACSVDDWCKVPISLLESFFLSYCSPLSLSLSKKTPYTCTTTHKMNIFAAQEKDKERMQTNQWRHRQTSDLQVANHLTFGTLRLMSPKSLGDGTNRQRQVDWFFHLWNTLMFCPCATSASTTTYNYI